MQGYIFLITSLLISVNLFSQETKVHPVQIHQSGATNNQVLAWDGNKWTPQSPSVGSDNQALSINTSTNIVTLENGGTIDLTNYLDNTDTQTISYNDNTGVLSIENGNNLTIDIGKRFVTEYIITTAGNSVSVSSSIAADKLDGVIVSRNGVVQRIGSATSDVSISSTTITFNLRPLVAGEIVMVQRPK